MNTFGRTGAALVAASALFGYIYFVESKKEPPKGDPESAVLKREKVFTGLDKLKIKSFTLQKRNGETVEARKEGEAWILVKPLETRADPGEIGSLLDALQNLESEEIASESSAELSAFGLAPPKVRVSLMVEGTASPLEFELGDTVPAGSSLFARLPGRPRIFTATSTLENTLGKSAFDLRDRSVLKVKKDGVLSVEVEEKGKGSFTLSRANENDNDWKIDAPLATRAARWTVDGFLGLIESLRMESIATEKAGPRDLAGYGLGGTARRVKLGLGAGASVTLEIGKKTSDGKYYARDASSTLVATIPAALSDDLDKGLKNLRATRLLDIATYEVNGFEVAVAGVARSFAKSTTKGKDGVDEIEWKSTAPARDAAQDKASEALLAIGGLEVQEFIDSPQGAATYGLDVPALRVTLRFEGGRRKDDWFEVAVKGNLAFARRRDDAAVLKLDKTKADSLIKSFGALGS